MKTLTLIRHAKSSWSDPTLADRDHPLTKRGRRDAPMMGERLAARAAAPDLIISSPALRALATAEAIAQAVGYPPAEIVVEERLFHAGVIDWLEVIQGLDDRLDRVICFGHNPGLTELVNELSSRRIHNLPTCGVVELEFDTETWARVDRIRPARVHFDYPEKPRP